MESLTSFMTTVRNKNTQFIFVTERGAPMTADGFRRMMYGAGESCDLPDLHPHMLRHSCGFALADRGKRSAGARSKTISGTRTSKTQSAAKPRTFRHHVGLEISAASAYD